MNIVTVKEKIFELIGDKCINQALAELDAIIKDEIVTALTAHTEEVIRKANKMFGIAMPRVTVKFDLRGNALATASVKNGEYSINYNTHDAEQVLHEILKDTVPHEVAHLVEYIIRGELSHSKYWRGYCIALGGSGKATREFDENFKVDTTGAKTVTKYLYNLGHKEIALTKSWHSKIQSGYTIYHGQGSNRITVSPKMFKCTIKTKRGVICD